MPMENKAAASGEPRKAERPDLSVLRMGPETSAAPRRRWGWLLLLAAAVAAAAWVWLAPAPFLLPKVETSTVQVVTQTEASTVLTASGYTYARNRAAIGSKIIGRILELRVAEGDRVRQGEVIAVLDSADLQSAVREMEADLEEKQAQLADAERENARQSRLTAAGVTAQSQADSAATQLKVARAQVGTAQARLEAARAQLDYTVIRSPLSGVVVQRNAEVGEMVAPGGFTTQQSTGAIVRIADPSSLEVEADINESYIARLKIGQTASIAIDAVPGRKYQGRLRQIVPTADRQKAVVGVKVTIDDADERLVPDMSTTVTFLDSKLDEIALAAKPRLYVAAGAVGKTGTAAWAFRLEGDRVHRVYLQLGEKHGDQVEVVSGLAGGDTVVRSGLEQVKDGQRVRRSQP
jgi:RND family efflux transporter MFP subunit